MMSQQRRSSLKNLSKEEQKLLLSQCEYLEHIKKNQSFTKLADISLNYDKVKVNQFTDLIIQFFYLCFTCFQNNINPQINQNFIVYSSIERKPILLINCFLKNQPSMKPENDKLYFTFFYKFLTKVVQIVQQVIPIQIHKKFAKGNRINEIWEKFQTAEQKQKQEKVCEENQQCKAQTQKFLHFKSYCEKLCQVIPNEMQCFLELQKCELIRQNSVLMQINFSSVGFYILNNKRLKDTLQQYLRIESNLIRKYILSKVTLKKCSEKLNCIEKDIENNMRRYFQTLKIQGNFKFLKYMPAEKNKIRFMINFKNKQEINNIEEQKQEHSLIFIVQFKKQAVTVKLLTPVLLDWVKSDPTLFNWNVFSFNTHQYSFENKFIEEYNSIKNYLFINVRSQINPNKSLITKVLKLIEGLSAFQITLLKFTKQNSFNTINPEKYKENGNKINHYLTISDLFFTNVMKKILY